MPQPDIIQTILKGSNCHLSLFQENEIEELRGGIFIRTTRGKETPSFAVLSVPRKYN